MGRRRPMYLCSFCGKSSTQVQRLIAGPGGVYICNECVALCNEIIAEDLGQGPRGTGPRPGRSWRGRCSGGRWRRFLPGRRQVLGGAP